MVVQGGQSCGGAGHHQQCTPANASQEPEQLQGLMQRAQVDVNPMEGQSKGGGKGKHPQPGQLSAPLPPLDQSCAEGEPTDQQSHAVALHLASIVFGDGVSAIDALKLGIGRGHGSSAELFTSVLSSGAAGTSPPGLSGKRAPK